jgi:K+-transporting ATPase ATPase C chain
MTMRNSPAIRQYLAALRVLLALTVIFGLAYPLVMTGVAQAAFHGNANGSLVHRDGKTVGSDLIGQAFTKPVLVNGKPKRDADGNPVVEPDPAYFQSRPSAAGLGYDPLSTSASNLGPENKDLIAAIKARRSTAAKLDGVAPSSVPPDALQASGSGLDPDISPAYAREQISRIARVRGLSEAQVGTLVDDHIQGRSLGFLGEPRVNVIELNLALDALARGR